jgi:hypothetical protein
MMLTASDIIQASMRKLGLLAQSEQPTSAEMITAMQALNMMIDDWNTEKLMMSATKLLNFPLVAGQQSYTIGVGGNFNTAKPLKIEYAYYLDNQNIKTVLDVVTREEFYSYEDSQIVTAPPNSLFYDPGDTQQTVQTGTIYIYYTPDATSPYQLYFNAQVPLTEFVNLTDIVTFPNHYYRALVYNLAVELVSEYEGAYLPPIVEMIATESKEKIEALNSTPILASNDLPKGRKQSYNWIADTAE